MEHIDAIAYYRVIFDHAIHDSVDSIHSVVGGFICSLAAVFTGGECGVAESVVSVSKIGTKAKNQAC